MAHTNTSAEAAIRLTKADLPYRVTLTPTTSTDQFWYEYTPDADEAMIGVLAWPASGDVGFLLPQVKMYSGQPLDLEEFIPNYIAGVYPLGFPVHVGTRYFLRCLDQDAHNPPQDDFELLIVAAPHDAVPRGAYLINDDTDGYPAAVLDPTTGDVVRFTWDVPAGEEGVFLPNGIGLFESTGIYDPTLEGADLVQYVPTTGGFRTLRHLSTAVYPPALTGRSVIRSNGIDTFYFTTNGVLYRLSQAGSVTASWSIGTRIYNFVVNPTGTRVYFTDIDEPSVGLRRLKRYDLTNSVALAPLHTLDAGNLFRDDGAWLEDNRIAIWTRVVSTDYVYLFTDDDTVTQPVQTLNIELT